MNKNLSFVLLVLLAGLSLTLSAPLSFNEHQVAQMADATGCNATESCASKGAACTGDITTPLACMAAGNNGSCCATGLYCVNSLCATDNMGSSCTSFADCHRPITSRTPINCVSGVCAYIYGPGDTCSNNTNCITGVSCVNTTCQGLTNGQACAMGLNQCAFGLYCGIQNLGTVCVNAASTGQSCVTSSQCYPGLSCVKSTCQTAYSQAAGAPCYDALSCEGGLTCASNGTCVSVTSSLVSCTANANCTANGGTGTCRCSAVTGNSFCMGGNYMYDPCTSEMADLNTCIASNNCTSATDAPESCCYANCLSEYKKSISCSCSMNDSLYGDCFYNQYCGGFPVWAIIVIIVVAIVLVLAIVLLVFFMMRRRRQYDSI